MSRIRSSCLLLTLVLLGVIVLDLLIWMRSPGRVPIHFGPSGQADGWASRDWVLGFNLGVKLVLTTLITGAAALVHRMPMALLSLPYKRRWLAAETRLELRSLLLPRLNLHLCMLLLFLSLTAVLSRTALDRDPAALDLPVFLGGLGVFLLFTLAWVIELALRLRRGPQGAA